MDKEGYTFDEEFMYKLHSQEQPTVVIIGWIGSNHKLLRKYSEAYFECRMNVFAFCPFDHFHWAPYFMRRLARKALLKLKELSLTSNVFVQCFSGNSVCLGQMVDLIEMEEGLKGFQIGGVVFDSCPRNINGQNAYQSLVELAEGNQVWKGTVYFMCILYSCVVDVDAMDAHHQRRLDRTHKFPKLFFFTEKDKFIDPSHVYSFAERQHKLNPTTPVFTRCWPDSKHVAHLLHHREEYLSLFSQFVVRALSFLYRLPESEVLHKFSLKPHPSHSFSLDQFKFPPNIPNLPSKL